MTLTLTTAIRDLNLCVIVPTWGTSRGRIMYPTDGVSFDPYDWHNWLITVGTPDGIDDVPTQREINAAHRGWIGMELPIITDNVLSMSVMSAMSTRFDQTTGEWFETPEIIPLFTSFARYFRRQIRYDVWVLNNRTDPPTSVRIRDIGSSTGAREWIEYGGELGYRGVPMQRFIVRDEKAQSIETQ